VIGLSVSIRLGLWSNVGVRLHWKNFSPQGEAFHLQSCLRTNRWWAGYHTHDFAEVFWIYAGSGRHSVNGQSQELRAGDVVFIRPEDWHNLETLPPQSLGLVNVAFPVDVLRHLRRRYFPDAEHWFWRRSTLPEICRLESARLIKLQEWAENLSEAPCTIFAIERFLMNLLHLAAVGVERELLPVAAPDWMASACRLIREKKHLQKGVEAWVRLAGRSPEHVARVTKKWLGLTPTEYVNQVRLAQVERQLRQTSLPIVELALEAGFSNLGYMYQLFKRRYGLSPLRYRHKYRKVIV
jgi:AraC family cel operon transcriptional repressor